MTAYRNDLGDIFIRTGAKTNRRYIEIAKVEITEEVRKALIPFHGITGTDITSQICGVTKSSGFEVLQTNAHLLQHLGEDIMPSEETIAKAEEFLCRLYEPHSNVKEVQKIRAKQFRNVSRSLDNIAPTQDAARQHILRAHLLARSLRMAHDPKPEMPEVTSCGFKEVVGPDGVKRFIPQLMTKSPMSEKFIDLISCGCATEDNKCGTKRCKCHKKGYGCSSLCKCLKDCFNPKNHTVR